MKCGSDDEGGDFDECEVCESVMKMIDREMIK